MKLKTQDSNTAILDNFTVKWCKGTTSHASDALSRSPVGGSQLAEILAEQHEECIPEMSILEFRTI